MTHTSEREESLALLGLRAGSSDGAVRGAWRALAATNHPDVGGDPDHFLRLTAARDRLLAGRGATSPGGPVVIVSRPTFIAQLLRPIRRRIDRRLNPRVH